MLVERDVRTCTPVIFMDDDLCIRRITVVLMRMPANVAGTGDRCGRADRGQRQSARSGGDSYEKLAHRSHWTFLLDKCPIDKLGVMQFRSERNTIAARFQQTDLSGAPQTGDGTTAFP